MLTDFVIDLETLGTDTSKPELILQIGVLGFNRFDTGEQIQLFNDTIKIASAKVDINNYTQCDSVEWWQKTNQEYFHKLLNCDGAIDLQQSLEYLYDWMNTFGSKNKTEWNVWGNGVNFDNEFLVQAFKNSSIQCPWTFRNDRCYRTLKAIVQAASIKESVDHRLDNFGSNYNLNNWFPHNALYDAVKEGLEIKLWLQRLAGRR